HGRGAVPHHQRLRELPDPARLGVRADVRRPDRGLLHPGQGPLGPLAAGPCAVADAAAVGRRVRHLPADQPRLRLLVGDGVDQYRPGDRFHASRVDVRVDLLVRGRRGGHPAGRRAHRRRAQPQPRAPGRRAAWAGDRDAVTEPPGPARDHGPGHAAGPAHRWAGLPADEGFRGHGMGRDLVEPDWTPLTDDEAAAVLARYGREGGGAAVRWRSPPPLSAGALVSCDGREVFVKRHHKLVRTAGQLSAEHALADHLQALGVAVPAVLRRPGGGSTVASGDYVYEVHALAQGADVYRDVLSW